ncbi:MAG: S8 family peptidase [Chloroflexi bacterium]|nr:S8 family peptidase [Chloroflexota bacterium]
MKNRFLCALLIAGLLAGLTGGVATAKEPERKIVTFQSGVSDTDKEDLIKKVGGSKIKKLDLIDGMAVYLPSKEAEKELDDDDKVLRIDDDIIVEALEGGGIKVAAPSPAETLPWGIDRIDADLVWGTTTGDPIKVGIIDTGIDVKHPDLIVNLKGGVSTVWYTTSYDDDNGHGTHVAGIVGAVDNEIGVIGVGPKIDLYGIKVLDRRGSGYLSDIVEGLDWSIKNGMQVVNLSLGVDTYNASFEAAIKRVSAAGIVIVAAAGNNGGAVGYPAKFAEVIAVSATDSSDKITTWSSRGTEVDLAAPGASIYSTYRGAKYKSLSGTSMASPHVAGVAALVLTTAIGTWDLDGDGIWDPAEVQNKLEATAEQVAPDTTPGKDNLYGSGLVDAEKAVKP